MGTTTAVVGAGQVMTATVLTAKGPEMELVGTTAVDTTRVAVVVRVMSFAMRAGASTAGMRMAQIGAVSAGRTVTVIVVSMTTAAAAAVLLGHAAVIPGTRVGATRRVIAPAVNGVMVAVGMDAARIATVGMRTVVARSLAGAVPVTEISRVRVVPTKIARNTVHWGARVATATTARATKAASGTVMIATAGTDIPRAMVAGTSSGMTGTAAAAIFAKTTGAGSREVEAVPLGVPGIVMTSVVVMANLAAVQGLRDRGATRGPAEVRGTVMTVAGMTVDLARANGAGARTIGAGRTVTAVAGRVPGAVMTTGPDTTIPGQPVAGSQRSMSRRLISTRM
ncbi:hypothetical protein [Propionibacterium sp.]|uniref:hypothetical protein n=1 Tax=Propionibacterium sp. TaxID=1977903 RepID=UPI0039E7D282